MGDTPAGRWAAKTTRPATDGQPPVALTQCSRRLVSRDGVISIDGTRYELRHHGRQFQYERNFV